MYTGLRRGRNQGLEIAKLLGSQGSFSGPLGPSHCVLDLSTLGTSAPFFSADTSFLCCHWQGGIGPAPALGPQQCHLQHHHWLKSIPASCFLNPRERHQSPMVGIMKHKAETTPPEGKHGVSWQTLRKARTPKVSTGVLWADSDLGWVWSTVVCFSVFWITWQNLRGIEQFT